MAGRNGTGPQGLGPMTGRGLGNCSQSVEDPREMTGYKRGTRGRCQRDYGNYGCQRRGNRGFGFGIRRISEEEEREILLQKRALLESQLKDLNQRLEQ